MIQKKTAGENLKACEKLAWKKQSLAGTNNLRKTLEILFINDKFISVWGSLLRKKSNLYVEDDQLGNSSFPIGYVTWDYYQSYPSRYQERLLNLNITNNHH